MNRAAVAHLAGWNYAFPVDGHTLKIRLKAARGDLKQAVIIYGSRYPKDGLDPSRSKKMRLAARDQEHDYFEVEVGLDDARFRYHFFLDDGNEQYWYNENGFNLVKPSGFKGGFFQYPVIEKNYFSTPDWVTDAIFYQIFPERFYNGNPGNDPEAVRPWGEKPGRDSFFGGDIAGIISKLDYLEELGVNALYLNPLFTSPSNHKYDTDDYLQIDPHFGDLQTARKLVEEAHRRGMKVILDGVFNHSGFNFFAFRDVREKQENSVYKDWYQIDSFPVRTETPLNYQTFASDIVQMPKLMTSNPEVREYLLDVAEYWTRELNLDGWRLDVADEIDHSFWQEFRRRVKGINPDAYIVAEIWHDSQQWLQGDQFDAVMNYKFTEAVIEFFGSRKINVETFDGRLSKNRMAYQDTVNYAMLNLLDSHDTARILHLFKENLDQMRLAVFFQMTYLGAPMVYYGDEVGMTGGDDPDCRRCMVWDQNEQDRELLAYYQRLIDLRKKLLPLRRGDFNTIIKDGINNVYGFTRSYQDEMVIVLLNNSPVAQRIKLDLRTVVEINKTELFDYCNQQQVLITDGFIEVEISPWQGVILARG